MHIQILFINHEFLSSERNNMKKSYLSSKIERRKSSHSGEGLFVKEKILKRELIIDFSTGPGTILNKEQAKKLFETGYDYMLQTGDGTYFAATNESELEDADFLNHSCDPNCGINGSLRIVALRDIKPGEELVFDYAMNESSEFEMGCNCGSKNCRKIITGNDWKDPELQKKYDGFFSECLQKKIDALRL